MFDPKRGCKHVNLIASLIPGEFEFLFSAYSAFEVKSVNWSNTPQDYARPHEITLLAAPDNKNDEDFPEYLRLASSMKRCVHTPSASQSVSIVNASIGRTCRS